MSGWGGVRIECDPCSKVPFDHNACERYVKAFIEPSGPDSYACECYCNRQRQRQATGDRKIRELLDAYRREFGADAVARAVAPYAAMQSGSQMQHEEVPS